MKLCVGIIYRVREGIGSKGNLKILYIYIINSLVFFYCLWSDSCLTDYK
jgi:hypothetical protein